MLSNLGIFHTAIGVIAIGAAVVSLVKNGKIDLGKSSGKIYFYTTLVTSITALGLSSVQGFNPGHALALLVVVLIGVAYYLHLVKKGPNYARYIETFALSFSFFLSMIPTVNESFNRLPVGHPLANGPKDPLIAKTLLILFVVFVLGSLWQFVKQRKANNSIKRASTN